MYIHELSVFNESIQHAKVRTCAVFDIWQMEKTVQVIRTTLILWYFNNVQIYLVI